MGILLIFDPDYFTVSRPPHYSFAKSEELVALPINHSTFLSSTAVTMGRLSHTEALLGPELFKKVRTTPILVVGAGGIGCELCK